MPSAEIPHRVNGRALEADPDTKAEVDLMILDYLASIAIDRTLCAADNPSQEIKEEVDWLVDSVRAFQTTVVTAHLETPLPRDLDIKIRVLRVANELRTYTAALAEPATEQSPCLSSIGMEFMDLCSAAISKISETRWFDTGARFMVQATLEEHRQGKTPSDMLYEFSAWMPGDPARHSKWTTIRQRYASELPDPGEMSAARDSLVTRFPFADFKASMLVFLFDLMTALDPPLLIQLERGQLGQLSRAETQRLKERIGVR